MKRTLLMVGCSGLVLAACAEPRSPSEPMAPGPFVGAAKVDAALAGALAGAG
jgi:hypothetical protein